MLTSAPTAPCDIARILVVDDETKLCKSLAEGLELEGWQTATATTGNEALALCSSDNFNIIVLDWMLPDWEGIEWLPEVRARGVTTPVLMLTARGSVADRLAGFNSGADDYLIKPFALAEIVARCRALLRRQDIIALGKLRCGELELDTHRRTAHRGDEEICLTPREVDILEYLMRRRDQPVTREMLAQGVWNETSYTAALGNAINIHVTRLRQKIEREDGPRLILTRHGIGYCMVTPSDKGEEELADRLFSHG